MREYPSPCDTCTRDTCSQTKCQPWRTRYLYRQKQINAFAKKIGVEPTEKPPIENPCNTYTNDDCHKICKARALYWDAAMEKLRKRMGV